MNNENLSFKERYKKGPNAKINTSVGSSIPFSTIELKKRLDYKIANQGKTAWELSGITAPNSESKDQLENLDLDFSNQDYIGSDKHQSKLDRVLLKQEQSNSSVSDRVRKIAQNNPDRADRIQQRHENRSERNITNAKNSDKRIAEDVNYNGSSKVLGTVGSVASSVPGIISTVNQESTSRKEHNQRTFSLASTGASLGSSFGIIGAGVGFFGGLIAGQLSGMDWEKKLHKKENKEAKELIANEEKQMKEQYFQKNNSEQIQLERDLFLKQQGYTV